ncbi:sensor histidine kinase [Jannaschia sp. M317]|uniref:GAF domain-containing sensor histidine kinase n=1 Tax=Jannaschia sp. M317 TaxID=2867011 RepID=UPI0021A7E6A7|nr:sensor histidine kinase [Jannaschia sp. M317]UWQ17903.1 sensor histidine kinase [Jannaschia sp. M317]
MPSPDETLTCFLSIARAIAGPTDYELVLENFAARLRGLISHDHLDIVLLHPSGTQICYEARLHTNWSREDSPSIATERSPIRAVLRGDLPFMLTDDAWTDARFHFPGSDSKPLFDANLHSRIVVPLRVQGEITGSMAISSHQIGVYDQDLVVLAQGAADLVSAYLFALERGKEARDAAVAESEARGREEALRLGALRLTEGMERERQRLGMDLHDQTLADLARIKRRLSRIAATLPEGSEDELRAIEAELETSLDDVRHIVEDMRPGVLQLFGFTEAVEAHLQRALANMARRFRTRVTDRTDGQIDSLPDTVRTAVFRIVQEGVNNAFKHSGASCIDIDIDSNPLWLQITITDNGSGISDDDLQSASGIGTIRTRASLISADVTIQSRSPESGTILRILMPYAAAVEPSLAAAPLTGDTRHAPAHR